MSEIEDLYEALAEAQDADQVASACAIYEQILTEEDVENLEATLLYVTDLVDLGNLSQAEATLLRLDELCPDELRGDWHYTFASFEEFRGQYLAAEKHYRQAHDLRTDRGDYLTLAANAAFQQGEPAKAEFLIREALKFQCDLAEAYGNLGLYLASQRRNSEAREAFTKALTEDPDNENAREWIADLDQIL